MAGETYDEICRGFSRRLGAGMTVLVEAASRDEALWLLGVDARGVRVAEPLGGRPIQVADLRELGRECRQERRVLVADNTRATSFGCAAVRLGAHVCVECLDQVMAPGEEPPAPDAAASCDDLRASRLYVLSLSKPKDVRLVLPDAYEQASALAEEAALSEALLVRLAADLSRWDGLRRKADDAAQVVASYLRCHPRVAEVRYPGLRMDPSYEVASAILHDGFGPVVDYRLHAGGGDGQLGPSGLLGQGTLADGEEGGAGTAGPVMDPVWHRVTCDASDPRGQVMALERLLAR